MQRNVIQGTKKGARMKKQQIWKAFGLFMCILLFFSGCSGKNTGAVSDNPGVKVTFFDVGKGDAILIETQKHTLLIDAGYEKTYQVIREYLVGQEIRKLDYLIVTHFDKDHVGGADWVVKDFEVGQILQPDYESDAGQYQEYCTALEEKGLQPIPLTETMQFTLDGAKFCVYPPQKEAYEEEDNDFSLVISMVYGEKSFLFAGDCEEERLKELLEQTEFDLSHDVLKVPHHGKKEDNSEDFLRAVDPEAAVITCSEKQPPGRKLYDMLQEMGVEVYLTSDGTVTCVCDGDTLQMIQG